MRHEKTPAGTGASAAACGRQFDELNVAPQLLQHRYPGCSRNAVHSLLRMAWDLSRAGGTAQLAAAIGCDRLDLVQHRWRLQIVAGLQLEVSHG